jgi:tetratricopeptide (TPR) repeat protein/predicted Ser/Thr protein kinase
VSVVHLDEETILQFTLGTLAAAREAEVQAHLRECADCQRRQQNISSIVFSKTVAGPETKPDRPGEVMATGLSRGLLLGHYMLLEKLGAGGMGEVFAAFDPRLDRRVAIKLLRSGSLSADEGKTRLQREAQAMARLQHPNVIAVHDVGTFADRVFIAMEFVEGETLGEWLRGERTWRDVVDVFGQAGRGLAAAHAAGLVHRDFKPDNVLLGKDGRPRVVDFGLARQTTSTPSPGQPMPELIIPDSALAQPLTRDGAVMGTPGYMAPEQIAGLPTDARTDQFSFCVALYEALYGKRPYGGATLRAHAEEISQGRLLPPAGDTDVPDEVYEALSRGLSNDPAKRWPDMDALLKALTPRQGLSGRLVILVASLTLLALAGTGFAVWQQRRLRVCGGQEKRLVDVWDEPRKRTLQSAFVASKVPGADSAWRAVERSVDAWALDWVNTSRDVCEATRVRKVDSEDVYELRQTCLTSRLDQLRAQLNLFEAADRDVVATATSAVASLGPPQGCLDARAPRTRPVDAAQQRATTALEAELTKARALFAASKYADGAAQLEKALTPGASSETLAEALLLLEHLQHRAGQKKKGDAALLEAAEYAMKAQDAALLARAFSRLAVSREEDELTDQAEVWNRLAHSAASRVPDEWEVLVELSLNDGIGSSHRKQHDDALKDFRNALTLQEQHLGPTHPQVAQTHNLLGATLTNLGRLDEAIGSFEKSLALHLALEGPEHSHTASAQHNLASTLRRKGRYADALPHAEAALATRRLVLGAEHLDTLRSMESLARTLQYLGRRDEALALLQELLEVRRRVLGPKTKDVATTCELLAELYAAGEDWREALTAADEELGIALALKGPDDALTARAHLTRADALVGLGQWSDAKKSLDEALRIRRAEAGPESLEVVGVLQAQGRLALGQRRGAEAKLLFEKALALREKQGSATHEALASSRAGLGQALLQLDQPKEAVAEFEAVLALLADVDDTRKLARAKVDLARALLLADPGAKLRAFTLFTEGLPGLTPREREQLSPVLEKAGLPLDAGRETGPGR